MSLAAFLPPELSEAALLALLGASFLASFITIAFGIGGGIALLAAMATLLPPAALIPVHGVVQLGSNLGRAALMIRHVHWAPMPAFLIGSALGAAFGGAVVVSLPPAAVEVAIGLFIVWAVFAPTPAFMRRWAWLTGAVSSCLTMFFGATGVFVAAFVRSLALGRLSHVGTHAAFMTVQHGVKSLAFGALGFAFAPWLPFIAAMILAGLAGTFAGRSVLTRLGDARFRLALNAILLALAARLVVSGVSGLIDG